MNSILLTVGIYGMLGFVVLCIIYGLHGYAKQLLDSKKN